MVNIVVGFVKFFFFKQGFVKLLFTTLTKLSLQNAQEFVIMLCCLWKEQNEKVWEGIEQQNYISGKLARISYAITESTK
jgi:hypothetical protein